MCRSPPTRVVGTDPPLTERSTHHPLICTRGVYMLLPWVWVSLRLFDLDSKAIRYLSAETCSAESVQKKYDDGAWKKVWQM